MKRSFDVAIATTALFCLSPILLLTAVCVGVTSRGPIIFRQRRLGRERQEFIFLKFRSMIQNSENIGTGLCSFRDDHRVTLVGRVLRNSSIDELPQLWCVLRGDMSIVGPRPPVHNELGDIDLLPGAYKQRFAVLPGITGLAQVSGRNDFTWDEKVKADCKYIEDFNRWGVLYDVVIMAKTLSRLFSTRGQYEKKYRS